MIQDIKDYFADLDPIHRGAFYISAAFIALGIIVLLVLYPLIAGSIILAIAIFAALAIILSTLFGFWMENF